MISPIKPRCCMHPDVVLANELRENGEGRYLLMVSPCPRCTQEWYNRGFLFILIVGVLYAFL